jgi:hypothetical protein
MRIRHMRGGGAVDEAGTVTTVHKAGGKEYLTTTIIAKYAYRDSDPEPELLHIKVAAVPNGMLQAAYNPNAADTIWRAGRNAESLGEAFRVRLVFDRLKAKSSWRVQHIPMEPDAFTWAD